MTCYVYALKRSDDTPFYVGKGRGERAYKHVFEARRGIDYNPHKNRIIRKMLASGCEPIVEIVREFDSDVEALAFEKQLIAEIGRLNTGTGPLVNITEGGDGVVGYPMTDEIRAAMSESAKRRFSDAEQRAWATENMRRIHACPQTKEKVRQALRRRWADETQRAAVSKQTSSHWQDPEVRARMIDGQRAYASSPEGRGAARDRLNKARAEGRHNGNTRSVLVNGVRYGSMGAAAASIGLNMKALSRRFSRYKKAGKFPDGWGYAA